MVKLPNPKPNRILYIALLFLITVLAAVLRLWKLNQVPPSLNWDEVSHGYNAYSLIKTGKDEWGNTLPLIFRAFGDYKLPLYIYLTTIPVFFLGLTTFSVRIISVIAGIAAIPGIYLLTNHLFRDKKIKIAKSFFLEPGLLAAFFLSISPWHFFISRPALEANLGLTLFIYGVYFLLKAIEAPTNYLLASIFLSLTLHTYNTYRVLTPLTILAFVLIYHPFHRSTIFDRIKTFLKSDQNPRTSLVVSLAIFALSFSVVVFQFFSGSGAARYSKLAILSPNAVYQIGQNRTTSKLPSILPRIIYNRPTYFAFSFAKNYLSYFSPAFLYQTWGPQYQFAIPGKNLLTLPIYLLFLVGIFFSIKRLKENKFKFIFVLLLLAPVAAALTADPPQSLRPAPMIIPFIVLSTFGTISLLVLIQEKFNKSIFTAGFLIYIVMLVSFSFSRYLVAYFNVYPITYADSWQYGYQQAFDYLKQHPESYQRLFISKALGEPHIFYAFYNQLDPKQLQPGPNNIRYQKSDWFWTDRLDNVYFVNDWQIPNNKVINSLPLESGGQLPVAHSLIITTFHSLPLNARVIKLIRRPDQSIALVIARFD